MRSRILLSVLAALLAILSSACFRGTPSERRPIHLNPNMDTQPKYRAQSSSDFFYDGSAMRLPVEGTVAVGELWEDQGFYTGRQEDGAFLVSGPNPDEAMLERGRERFGIYCSPCHGEQGGGRGVLYERAGVESADLNMDRIRNMPDGQIYDVITNGLGLMPGYRYPIPPDDRWAIVAHVRELQKR